MRSPPNSRNASAASSPATPPPTMSTLNVSPEEPANVTTSPGRTEAAGGTCVDLRASGNLRSQVVLPAGEADLTMDALCVERTPHVKRSRTAGQSDEVARSLGSCAPGGVRAQRARRGLAARSIPQFSAQW